MQSTELSTLQALLMLLKANQMAFGRERHDRFSNAVVQCVRLAKRLGLDDHFRDHQAGIVCEHSSTTCQLLKRIWEVILCEVVVGGSQGEKNCLGRCRVNKCIEGRHDHPFQIYTRDTSVLWPVDHSEQSESDISRNFNYFSSIVRIVTKVTKLYAQLGGPEEGSVVSELQLLGKFVDTWFAGLPPDMRIDFPWSGLPPFVPPHFVGKMHAYYHLARILVSQQIWKSLDRNDSEEQWNHHVIESYRSAKALYQLQDGTFTNFGRAGICCLKMGLSSFLYAGLYCFDIYLVRY